MSEWTRRQVWAERDASHRWRMRAHLFGVYVILVLAWSAIARIGYVVNASSNAPVIHEDTIDAVCPTGMCSVTTNNRCVGG